MKLREVVLKNFRSYKEETRIPIKDLTAIIGKNDIGKSTIFEALEIFFNSNLVKIDKQDKCVYSDENIITIGCVFEDLPERIILDATATTNLKEEYLLNNDNLLEIHKKYDTYLKTIKEDIYAIALHPVQEIEGTLLCYKNNDLKNEVKKLNIEKGPDLRTNAHLRKAIRESYDNSQLCLSEIPLNKEDGKKIWDQIYNYLPTYALFQADRSCKDSENEVQDPMKLAVKEAIKSVQEDLTKIKVAVENKAKEIADATVRKLVEIDSTLASTLKPEFQGEPKWESIFKLSLTGDYEIPINKRGSGVRRLVLLSFFRADAERRLLNRDNSSIIYAIEEPETSQHPNYQKLLINTFLSLSKTDNCQVLLTTHVPGLAGYLPVESLVFLEKRDIDTTVNYYKQDKDNDVLLEKITTSLGIIPDNRIKALLYVEGPNDINFLKNVSKVMHKNNNNFPDLNSENRIAIIPLGGSNLRSWVQKHYLKKLNKPEIHIYDRDTEDKPKYQNEADIINSRSDGSKAFITSKREMENYIHPTAIKVVMGIDIDVEKFTNVPFEVASLIHDKHSPDTPWRKLDAKKQSKEINNVKYTLNTKVASAMTYQQLEEIDKNKDIESWFDYISKVLKSEEVIHA